MCTPADRSPDVHMDVSSKMDVLDETLASLVALQRNLDKFGFSMSSIHLNNAIETLRADRIRLRNHFKV